MPRVCKNGYLPQSHLGNIIIRFETTATHFNMTNLVVFSTVNNSHFKFNPFWATFETAATDVRISLPYFAIFCISMCQAYCCVINSKVTSVVF